MYHPQSDSAFGFRAADIEPWFWAVCVCVPFSIVVLIYFGILGLGPQLQVTSHD